MSVPAADLAWATAKRLTPTRPPFTDEELHELRVRYGPDHCPPGLAPCHAVTIWTLLDMIEAQKGWTA
jgi:hypothetical protein